MTSQVSDDSNIVLEGSLSQKSCVLFVVRWKKKYVTIINDERQLVIYDKKQVSGASRSAGECQTIELKQICECKAVESSKKRSVFLLRRRADAGGKNQIIFRCSDPDDRDKWISTINDVMNGKVVCRNKCPEFDEVVVSTDSLRHLVKSRPKFEGRRMPAKRPRTQHITSPTTVLNGVTEEADATDSVPTTDQATNVTAPTPNDAETTNGVSRQTPQSPDDLQSRVAERQISTNESMGDTEVQDGSTKSEKLSTLQRLKRTKKSGGSSADGGKAAKGDKNPSLLNRIGARISRVFGGSQSNPPAEVGQTDETKESKTKVTANVDVSGTLTESDETHQKGADESDQNGTDGLEKHAHVEGVSATTKAGQAKVIQELAAIAQTAQLVAHKAEALKDAMKDTSKADEEVNDESAEKSLIRRDSEKSIQQAAQSLRSTLKNLSEAEILEKSVDDESNEAEVDEVEVDKVDNNEGELTLMTNGEQTADPKSENCTERGRKKSSDHDENEDDIKVSANENCEKEVTTTNAKCEEEVISTNETCEKDEGKKEQAEPKEEEDKHDGEKVEKPIETNGLSLTDDEKLSK